MTITDLGKKAMSSAMEVQYNPTSMSLSRSVDYTPAIDTHRNFGPLTWKNGKNDTLKFQLLLDYSEVRADNGGTSAGNLNPFSGGIPLPGLTLSIGAPKTEKNTITAPLMALYALTLGFEHEAGKKSSVHPPLLRIEWGDMKFVGSISSMKADIILFNKEGNPLRATVDLEILGWFYTDGINDKESAATLASQKASDVKAKVDAGKS